MNKGIFYLLTLVAAMLVAAAPMMINAVHKHHEQHACKLVTAEITKTEGDLTWTDTEQVCE